MGIKEADNAGALAWGLNQGEREPYLSLNSTSVELPARSDDSRPGGGKKLNFRLHFEYFAVK